MILPPLVFTGQIFAKKAKSVNKESAPVKPWLGVVDRKGFTLREGSGLACRY
jgi:hypothetical protein